MPRLADKRILITGPSSGVRLAAVERFAREGADLALVARGAAALEEAATVAREHGVAAHVLPADVADRGGAAAAVAALGGLDVVVLNAVAVAFGHFLEVDADDFDRTVAITFTGAVNVVRTALPELRATGGAIVATSSLMAELPLPAFSSYAAAKHGLRGFLNTVAVEEREQRTGVRVAMVSPGPVDTAHLWTCIERHRPPAGPPPDSYHPESVAAALAEATLRPRHERIQGGQAKLFTCSTARMARGRGRAEIHRTATRCGRPSEEAADAGDGGALPSGTVSRAARTRTTPTAASPAARPQGIDQRDGSGALG